MNTTKHTARTLGVGTILIVLASTLLIVLAVLWGTRLHSDVRYLSPEEFNAAHQSTLSPPPAPTPASTGAVFAPGALAGTDLSAAEQSELLERFNRVYASAAVAEHRYRADIATVEQLTHFNPAALCASIGKQWRITAQMRDRGESSGAVYAKFPPADTSGDPLRGMVDLLSIEGILHAYGDWSTRTPEDLGSYGTSQCLRLAPVAQFSSYTTMQAEMR